MVDMENMNSDVGVKGLKAIWQVFIFLSFASGRLYIRIVKMGHMYTSSKTFLLIHYNHSCGLVRLAHQLSSGFTAA